MISRKKSFRQTRVTADFGWEQMPVFARFFAGTGGTPATPILAPKQIKDLPGVSWDSSFHQLRARGNPVANRIATTAKCETHCARSFTVGVCIVGGVCFERRFGHKGDSSPTGSLRTRDAAPSLPNSRSFCLLNRRARIDAARVFILYSRSFLSPLTASQLAPRSNSSAAFISSVFLLIA
jgi:hypothetical protein